MAKTKYDFVSLLGWLQSIMIGLLRRIERLGGSEDQLIALASAENELIEWIAKMIVQTDGGRKMDRPYKNWPTICEALQSDRQINKSIVWANALADINGELARRLALAFPEFWSEIEVQGPVPWSLLCDRSRRVAASERGNWECLLVWGALDDFDIPTRSLVTGEYDSLPDWAEEDGEAPIRPEHIPIDISIGETVEWRGGNWIVIENSEAQDRIVIVPAQCIALDL